MNRGRHSQLRDSGVRLVPARTPRTRGARPLPRRSPKGQGHGAHPIGAHAQPRFCEIDSVCGAITFTWCTQVEPIIEKFVDFHKVLIPVRAADPLAWPAVRRLAMLTLLSSSSALSVANAEPREPDQGLAEGALGRERQAPAVDRERVPPGSAGPLQGGILPALT